MNEKKQISGNTDMRNLATLFVLGLRKYPQSLFRPKKPTRWNNFAKIFDIIGVRNLEKKFGRFLGSKFEKIKNPPCGDCYIADNKEKMNIFMIELVISNIGKSNYINMWSKK